MIRYFIILLLSLFFSIQANALESYADLVEEVMPSVVNILTEKVTVNADEKVDNLMVEPELPGREALGSGFFIRKDGYILTNYHVIKDAKAIYVINSEGKDYKAKLISFDAPSDLAVIKLDLEKDSKDTFKSVIFGDADKTRIGDKVLTFGNPYGLGISVSEGIISAKSRHIGLGEQQYIQTDAAINQGNSGGPMFNTDGEVIGINTAVFTVKGATGVGFALPSNIANWVSSQLIDGGKVRRGWLGITVSKGIDRYTGKEGFIIAEISEESNAYKEGLRVGDIIIAYNDRIADNIDAFRIFTETMEPGQALRLKTSTLGEETRNVVRVQEMPENALKSVTNKALSEHSKYYHQSDSTDIFYISELHIAVKEATPRGLMIMKLERQSPLSEKGIKIGDIILEADGADVFSSDNLLDTLRTAAVDDFRPISLLIQGTENTFYVNIEVKPEND